MPNLLITPAKALSTFLSPAAWRLWLILAIAVIATGVSLTLGVQGKRLEYVRRDGEALLLTRPGQAAFPVVSFRRPDQGAAFALVPSDFTTQIEAFETYKAFDTYRDRQDRMKALLDHPSVLVGIKPDNRPAYEVESRVLPLEISDFGPGFWVSLGVGLTAFMVGGWVWCLKPHEIGTRILAVNGLGMLIAAVASCATFAQPLGISSHLIEMSLTLNHFGTVIFGQTLVGLFLIFPKPIVSGRQFAGIMAIGVPVFAADYFRLLGGPGGIMFYCFAVIVAVIVLVAIQLWVSRGEPKARASLIWLGLAVVVGGGSWGIILLAYVLQGQFHAMPESFIFLSFLILYVGVAVGVARFRLFDVGDWAFRIFFFTVAAAIFIGLDAGLVYVIGLARPSALTLALLVVAFGYLPFRDMLWRRFFRAKALSDNEMLASVLDMAFAPEASQRQGRWQDLLQRLFAPVSIAPSPVEVGDAHIGEDGLHLYVPRVVDTPALRLSYPQSGRGLFAPRHVDLVNQIVRLSRKAAQGLSAYERGAAEQRQRLAQDLHDDVGAKLVSGLSVADEASRPFIYGALNDIRDIASALLTESAPLDRVMAEMRHETVRRLDAVQIELDWPLWPEDAPFIQLPARHKKAMTSTVREIITNAIKHSRAKRISVVFTVTGTTLTARIDDDGTGFPDVVVDGVSSGQGLRSVADRIGQLGGSVRFDSLRVGARVAFDLPLEAHTEGSRL